VTPRDPAQPRLGSVVINVVDIERLKEFWTALLDVGVRQEFAGAFLWLEPQREGSISVALQKVDNPTEGRNRLHLDFGVGDLEAATERVKGLGGSLIEEHTIDGFTWRVMADPEGNEFCIAPG